MAFWNWFQTTYDKLDEMNWSPEMKEKIDRLDKMIPKVISKALIGYIESQYGKSEEYAKRTLDGLVGKINEAINPIK